VLEVSSPFSRNEAHHTPAMPSGVESASREEQTIHQRLDDYNISKADGFTAVIPFILLLVGIKQLQLR
jgi:hypothetical protein